MPGRAPGPRAGNGRAWCPRRAGSRGSCAPDRSTRLAPPRPPARPAGLPPAREGRAGTAPAAPATWVGMPIRSWNSRPELPLAHAHRSVRYPPAARGRPPAPCPPPPRGVGRTQPAVFARCLPRIARRVSGCRWPRRAAPRSVASSGAGTSPSAKAASASSPPRHPEPAGERLRPEPDADQVDPAGRPDRHRPSARTDQERQRLRSHALRRRDTRTDRRS